MTTVDIDAGVDPAALAYHHIPVELVSSAPDNPRWDLGLTDDLVNSVAAVGVIQALLVRPHPDEDGRFEVVCGHRRLGAAMAAGRETVPCIVRDDLDDVTRKALMIEENRNRSELSPIEDAYAIQSMIELPGMTQGKVADIFKISQPTVSKRLKLLKLPQVAQDALHTGYHDPKYSARITVEQAEKLADVDPAAVEKLFAKGTVRSYDVDNLVVDWEEEQELAKKRSAYEAGGVTIIERNGAWDRKNGPVPVFWLALDDDFDHTAELCHAVAITNSQFTEVCTNPSSHDDPVDAKREAAEKRRRAKEAKEREEAEQLSSEAAAARDEFLRSLFAAGDVPLGADAHVASWTVFKLDVEWSTAVNACRLLDIDVYEDVWDELEVLAESWTAIEMQRFALAMALSDLEMQLGNSYVRWTARLVARHFDFLRSHGYQPTDWEKEQLAIANAERLKREVEASARAAVEQDEIPSAHPVEVVGADNAALNDTGEEDLGDAAEPEMVSEPAVVHTVKVTKSGKKWRVKCSCGGINALNTTEAYAEQARDAHLGRFADDAAAVAS